MGMSAIPGTSEGARAGTSRTRRGWSRSRQMKRAVEKVRSQAPLGGLRAGTSGRGERGNLGAEWRGVCIPRHLEGSGGQVLAEYGVMNTTPSVKEGRKRGRSQAPLEGPRAGTGYVGIWEGSGRGAVTGFGECHKGHPMGWRGHAVRSCLGPRCGQPGQYRSGKSTNGMGGRPG